MMIKKLQPLYKETIVPKLLSQRGYKNIHQVPKIINIALNMGVGEAATNSKVMDYALHDLGLIAGQRPIITRAKKSNANFKIRQGMPIGCKVTIRDDRRIYEFLERLIYIALPRTKGFKGLSIKNFDGQGNLNFGIREQLVFPEIDYDKIDQIRGLNISIITSATTDQEGKDLLSELGFPFI